MPGERVEVITRAERRRRWSVADKLRLVAATRAPGMTVASVARQHEVSESLLYSWRRRLAGRGLVDAPAGLEAGFVPVVVTGERRTTAAAAIELVEIELPNGCRLRVSERIGTAPLRRMIMLLGGLRP